MMKINYILLVFSLMCITVWLFSSYQILKNLVVRVDGNLISVDIADFGCRKFNRYAKVNINGVEMDAGGIGKEYKLGDTIRVCYVDGINTVVQERFSPNRYYCFLGLSSILLIVGIVLFVESLKGKSIWSYL